MIKGMICLFFGLISAIPDGWFLCDGNNDTPDLRNRFVVGAGDVYNPGDSAGAINHAHPFTDDGSGAGFFGGTDIEFGYDRSNYCDLVFDSGITDSQNGLPPYYTLSYIMKEG